MFLSVLRQRPHYDYRETDGSFSTTITAATTEHPGHLRVQAVKSNKPNPDSYLPYREAAAIADLLGRPQVGTILSYLGYQALYDETGGLEVTYPGPHQLGPRIRALNGFLPVEYRLMSVEPVDEGEIPLARYLGKLASDILPMPSSLGPRASRKDRAARAKIQSHDSIVHYITHLLSDVPTRETRASRINRARDNVALTVVGQIVEGSWAIDPIRGGDTLARALNSIDSGLCLLAPDARLDFAHTNAHLAIVSATIDQYFPQMTSSAAA